MTCFFNTSFGESFMKKFPTLLQNGANLAPPHYYSSYASLLFSMLCYSSMLHHSSCFIVPLCVLLFLFVFHHSSCLAAPLCASLLFSVHHHSFSYFIVPLCVSLLLLVHYSSLQQKVSLYAK